MNDKRSKDGGSPADVLSIACARWEAAVLEGRTDTWTREHERTCPRCSQMGAEHDRIGGLIAQVTGPAPVPASFMEAVLSRAEALDAGFDDRESVDDDGFSEAAAIDARGGEATSRTRVSIVWLGAAAMAAGMALAFWAGGLNERSHHSTTPAAVEAALPVTAPAPVPAAQDAQAATVESAPPMAAQPTRLLPLPSSQPAAQALAPVEPPVVPSARPVPEPAMDLAAELRSSLVREIGALDACPAKAAAPIRVTVTVGTDGTLSNRQILSSADASDAHQCVGRAMDRLLLPPLDHAATITLDVNW
jgi:hypothetical protein